MGRNFIKKLGRGNKAMTYHLPAELESTHCLTKTLADGNISEC
jgi:hypothetical protein